MTTKRDCETAERLSRASPETGLPVNPIDLGGDATPARHAEALKILLSQKPDDGVLVIHGPSGLAASQKIYEACAALVRKSRRNVLAC